MLSLSLQFTGCYASKEILSKRMQEVMGQWNALQDGLRTLALLSRGGSCFADEELLSHERDGEAWLSKDSECNRGEWRTWVARDEDHEEGGMRGMHAWPPISVERLHRLQRALKDAEEKYQQQLCGASPSQRSLSYVFVLSAVMSMFRCTA